MCSVIRAIQDPDTVYEQLGGHNLHMRLHSFRGLGGLEPQQGLQVRVRCVYPRGCVLRG